MDFPEAYRVVLYFLQECHQEDIELQNVVNTSLQETSVLLETQHINNSHLTVDLNGSSSRSVSGAGIRAGSRSPSTRIDVDTDRVVVVSPPPPPPPPYEERVEGDSPPRYEEVTPGEGRRRRTEARDTSSEVRRYHARNMTNQLRIEGHFGFRTFWTKFWNILKSEMNFKFVTIVQIFRKIIQLNAVIIFEKH